MKKTVKLLSVVLLISMLVPFTTGCKDEKYLAYDSNGEKYDYYLPDYVKVCKYTGIELPDITYEPTEEDLDLAIMGNEALYCNRTQDPPRPCQKGDVVDIITTCVMKDTGETYGYFYFTKGSNDFGQSFVLGVNYFGFPELDEAVIGMSQGETKTVTLTLPDPFYKDFINSGKELEMEIYLNYIDEVDYSDATDEMYAENFGYSKANYRELMRNKLIKEKNEQIEGYKAKLAWNYICENSKLLKVPEKEYQDYYDLKLDSARNAAKKKDLSLLEYVNKELNFDTLEDYYAYLKDYCENLCYEEMILYYIMRCENLKEDDDYYNNAVLEMVSDYQITDAADGEDFLAYYYGIDNVREQIRMMYIQDWIADQGKVRSDIHTVYSDKLN